MTTAQLLNRLSKMQPYRIPEIDTSGGCFKIETDFLGKKFYKVTHSMDEILQAYFEFCIDARRIEIPRMPAKKAQLVYSTRKSIV